MITPDKLPQHPTGPNAPIIAGEPTVLINKSEKKYKCIYADPPWDKNIFWNESFTSVYPRMHIDQIVSMGPQIREISHPEGCHLWMWAVAGWLKETIRVAEAWGFHESDFVFWAHDWMRMGKVRHQGEILMFFEREPHMPLLSVEEINWEFTANWRGVHSEKPDVLRKKVERCSPGPRLEMFARTKPLNRENEWDTWGNDPGLKNDIELIVPFSLERGR